MNNLTHNEQTESQASAENIFQKIHYESYDDWIANFALNLSYIWKENSAKEINIIYPIVLKELFRVIPLKNLKFYLKLLEQIKKKQKINQRDYSKK